MSDRMETFTKITGLSDRRRLPRLGKIRMGIKAISEEGKSYPKEVPFFVVPAEVKKIYGEKPVELDIFFPVNDPAIIFPQRYEHWGAGGLKCFGDGTRARRSNGGDQREERNCPCESLGKGCGPRGRLIFILPKVSIGGCYQIDVGSRNSIVDLNSGLDYLTGLIGRFSGVPLKLRRVSKETHGSGRKEVHYPLQIFFEGNLQAVESLRRGESLLLPDQSREEKPSPSSAPIGQKGESESSFPEGEVSSPLERYLEEMKKYRAKVGKSKFEEILTGRWGVMTPEEITEPKEQTEILNEMEEAYQKRIKQSGEGR
jgi:hypothetical protein